MTRFFRIALPVLMIVALVLAPLTSKTAAAAMAHGKSAAMIDMAVPDTPANDMSMAGMEDMPCCPDEAPSNDCAKTCPLMMLCMAKCFQGMPFATSAAISFTLAGFIVPGNDALLRSLAPPPPARPPRT